jgi:hypothetical protein
MAEIDIIVYTQFIILSIVCFFLIRYYKSKFVTFDVSFSVYLCWVFGFAGILLLPYDLSIAVVGDVQSIKLLNIWKSLYWSTFLLTWIILPMQDEYHSSGHFSFKDKLYDASMKNLLYLGIASTAAIVYIIYMVSTGSGSPLQIIALMMAMGNTYGVFIIIVLMGSGLVGLPRRLWQISDSNTELKRIYISAPSIESSYQESRFELEDIEADVSTIFKWVQSLDCNNKKYIELMKYVDILNDSVNNFEFVCRSTSLKYAASTTSSIKNIEDTNKQSLVDLNSKLKKIQIKVLACEKRWRILLKKCERYEQVTQFLNGGLDNTNVGWNEMKTEVTNDSSNKLWWWQKKFCCQPFLSTGFRIICIVSSTVCAIMSVIILWSELVMSSSLHSPIGIFIGAYGNNTNKILIQIVSFVFLSYMSVCTYWSLFRINLGWSYTLYGPQQSPHSSLIFNGVYFTKLQFSLGYNFLMYLNVPRTDKTAFSLLLSDITIIPVFGASFTVYVPIVMIIIAIISLFNGFSRFLSIIGMESEDNLDSDVEFINSICCSKNNIDDTNDNEKLKNGKRLVENAFRKHNGLVSNKDKDCKTPSIALHKLSALEESRKVLAISNSRNSNFNILTNNNNNNNNNDDNDMEIELNSPTFVNRSYDIPPFYTTPQVNKPTNSNSRYSIVESDSPNNMNPIHDEGNSYNHNNNHIKGVGLDFREEEEVYMGRYSNV